MQLPDSPQILMANDSAGSTYQVCLNVYDVSNADEGGNSLVVKLNNISRELGLGGVFHGAIELQGFEWSFGWCESGTGVYCVHARKNPMYVYRETIDLGTTSRSRQEIKTILQQLKKTWSGTSYELLSRNCCHFCEEFAKELGVKPVPGWLNRFATSADATVAFTNDAVALAKSVGTSIQKASASGLGWIKESFGKLMQNSGDSQDGNDGEMERRQRSHSRPGSGTPKDKERTSLPNHLKGMLASIRPGSNDSGHSGFDGGSGHSSAAPSRMGSSTQFTPGSPFNRPGLSHGQLDLPALHTEQQPSGLARSSSHADRVPSCSSQGNGSGRSHFAALFSGGGSGNHDHDARLAPRSPLSDGLASLKLPRSSSDRLASSTGSSGSSRLQRAAAAAAAAVKSGIRGGTFRKGASALASVNGEPPVRPSSLPGTPTQRQQQPPQQAAASPNLSRAAMGSFQAERMSEPAYASNDAPFARMAMVQLSPQSAGGGQFERFAVVDDKDQQKAQASGVNPFESDDETDQGSPLPNMSRVAYVPAGLQGVGSNSGPAAADWDPWGDQNAAQQAADTSAAAPARAAGFTPTGDLLLDLDDFEHSSPTLLQLMQLELDDGRGGRHTR